MTVAAPIGIAQGALLPLEQAAAAAPSPASQTPAPQSLVEYLAAANPEGLANGASPSELGQSVITSLGGFFDRSQSMTSKARALFDTTPPSQVSMTLVHRGPAQAALAPSAMPIGPQTAKGAVDGSQIGRVIQALGVVYDYSIETQLVVRGATQVSGAANTLLRGQ